jgi:hypothetical protein
MQVEPFRTPGIRRALMIASENHGWDFPFRTGAS